MDPFILLPKELVRLISELMDIKTLCQCCKVNKTWKKWAEDTEIWKEVCRRTWKLQKSDVFFGQPRDWKFLCKNSKMVAFKMEMEDEIALEMKEHLNLLEDKEKLQGTVKYSGDPRGIIGTHLSMQDVQPTVICSGIGKGNAPSFIDNTTEFCWTTNRINSWYRVDLGEKFKVVSTHYSLRYGSSGNYCVPRHWVLQGSNNTKVELDPENNDFWVTLRTHENDQSMNVEFAWFVYDLPNNEAAFRYFRVLQTGPNAYQQNQESPTTGEYDIWSHVLVTTGFDIWGLLIKIVD